MQLGPKSLTQSAPSVNRSTKPLNMIFNDVKQSSIEGSYKFFLILFFSPLCSYINKNYLITIIHF